MAKEESKEVIVKLAKRVKITGTGTGKHLKEGQTYEVSEYLADKFVKKGVAKLFKTAV